MEIAHLTQSVQYSAMPENFVSYNLYDHMVNSKALEEGTFSNGGCNSSEESGREFFPKFPGVDLVVMIRFDGRSRREG
jgi:hypothetical protein